MVSTDNLIILGVRPSRPVALVASNELILDFRSANFINGILK